MARRLLLFIIRQVYQRASRSLWPSSCRFRPTCSEYTAQAVEKYGCLRGSWMGLTRIARCHPWNAGGDDPLR